MLKFSRFSVLIAFFSVLLISNIFAVEPATNEIKPEVITTEQVSPAVLQPEEMSTKDMEQKEEDKVVTEENVTAAKAPEPKVIKTRKKCVIKIRKATEPTPASENAAADQVAVSTTGN